MSYQTSSKRLPLFWLLIGQKNTKTGLVRHCTRGSSRRSLLFFVPYFSARLDFPSPPLSAPGSPRRLPSKTKRDECRLAFPNSGYLFDKRSGCETGELPATIRPEFISFFFHIRIWKSQWGLNNKAFKSPNNKFSKGNKIPKDSVSCSKMTPRWKWPVQKICSSGTFLRLEVTSSTRNHRKVQNSEPFTADKACNG